MSNPNTISISVPDAFDQYEMAVLSQLQSLINTRRAAIDDRLQMIQLEAASDKGFADWQHAVQIASGDPNNPDLQMAELIARMTYVKAYNAYHGHFAASGDINLKRSTVYAQVYAALPGLLVNPNAQEAMPASAQ